MIIGLNTGQSCLVKSASIMNIRRIKIYYTRVKQLKTTKTEFSRFTVFPDSLFFQILANNRLVVWILQTLPQGYTVSPDSKKSYPSEF